MSENVCVDCKYFMGFDGVGELWTSCSIHGDFKVKTTSCKYFEKKVTKSDLLNKIQSLEKENEQLRKELNDCEKFRYTVLKRIEELSNAKLVIE